jgi:Neuraminidase (sialidase)
VKGQYDPLVEVVPQTGDLYAVWMNNFHITFSASTDHGNTWSNPVFLHPNRRWGDKPNMAVSPDGRDIYVLFNGPSVGDVHASSSHDGGQTWSTVRVTNSARYYYDYGGIVLPSGRVLFSHISFDYSGPDSTPLGPVLTHLLASDDAGVTWSDQVIDELEAGTVCTSRGCYADFYDSGPVLAVDTGGDLVMVYSGASEPGGNRTVYARTSVDGGLTWTERIRISRTGVNAAYAAAAGRGDDEVRVYFADQRTGAWNVRYRTSTDLGITWSKAVRISDAISGTAYKDHRGFREFYGDYGEIAITSAGKTVAVWGEGPSYYGPGGIWFNRER